MITNICSQSLARKQSHLREKYSDLEAADFKGRFFAMYVVPPALSLSLSLFVSRVCSLALYVHCTKTAHNHCNP